LGCQVGSFLAGRELSQLVEVLPDDGDFEVELFLSRF
jgi:hypothetical protein